MISTDGAHLFASESSDGSPGADDLREFSIAANGSLSNGPTDSAGTDPGSIAVYPPASSHLTLSVAKAGSGSGTVTSSPGGISCGAACSATYKDGTLVTLTTKPASGSQFTGWSGACMGTGTCKVTMNADKRVTATFKKIVPPPNTTITGVHTSSAKRKARFDFTGSGGVGVLHFQCKLDSGSWKSCTSPKTYTGLGRGSHIFAVRAIDARGKADPTPAKRTFTI